MVIDGVMIEGSLFLVSKLIFVLGFFMYFRLFFFGKFWIIKEKI